MVRVFVTNIFRSSVIRDIQSSEVIRIRRPMAIRTFIPPPSFYMAKNSSLAVLVVQHLPYLSAKESPKYHVV